MTISKEVWQFQEFNFKFLEIFIYLPVLTSSTKTKNPTKLGTFPILSHDLRRENTQFFF